MRPAHATYRGGHVAFDGPVNWPDGIRVVVVPEHDEMESVGITESEWPQTDDQRREWLAWYDSREPLERTAEEVAQSEAERRRWEELQKQFMRKNWEDVERLFE